MDQTITPVLLCGGSGTRLWPLSRKSYPKQFSPLLGAQSLFQASAGRMAGPGFNAPVIVTTDAYRFIVTEQLSTMGIEPAAILIEPEGRDTAPSVLAAALEIASKNPKAIILVAPSDHVIPETELFTSLVKAAVPAVHAGRIITFGIPPQRPETGYGYLELKSLPSEANEPIDLKRFVEKPTAAVAEEMISSGSYLWNAGIFLAKAATLIAEFEKHASHLVAPVEGALNSAFHDLNFTRLDPAEWERIAAISLDYAVMEKSDALSVLPYSGQWSDLGDWASVWRETEVDGLATSGAAIALNCSNSLLRSEIEGQAIVGVGLRDIIAVAMPDAVLISHKDNAQDVKEAVSLLREREAPQADAFPKDHRPWGWFESLARGDRFQVKRIVVHPGAALSLQSHHHRSEHWVVVEGTAKVTIGETVSLVTENQSVYIPVGEVHRMENPGKLPMVLIEVQTGAYLGEDDIVRFEDVYRRA